MSQSRMPFFSKKTNDPQKLCQKCGRNYSRKTSILCRDCINHYDKIDREKRKTRPRDPHYVSYCESFLEPWEVQIVRAESQFRREAETTDAWERYLERRAKRDKATKKAVITLLNNSIQDLGFPIMDVYDNILARRFVKQLSEKYHIPYVQFEDWLIREKYIHSKFISSWMKDENWKSSTMNKILRILWMKYYRNEETIQKEYPKPSECAICLESLANVDISLDCGHWIHMDCIVKTERPYCPICQQKLTFEKYQHQIRQLLQNV